MLCKLRYNLSSQREFGPPVLVGAINTFSELIHPLIKLPNCVLKFYNLSEAFGSFGLLPPSRSMHRLCWRTPTSTHFWSSTLHTTFHREAKPKTALELLDALSRFQVQTITRAILPRNQSPSVPNSQRGWSCEQIFDSSTTFLNSQVGTNSLCGKRTVGCFLSPHTPYGRLALLTPCHSYTTLTLTPRFYRFLYWFWQKNRLYCSLLLYCIYRFSTHKILFSYS